MSRIAAVALLACALSPAAFAAQQPAGSPSPPIHLVGSDSQGKLALSGVTTPDVRVRVTLENTGTKVLRRVSLDVSSFAGSSGESPEAKVAPRSADIQLRGRQEFFVSATLLTAGTFSANARVLQAGRSILDFEVQVVRTREKLRVDIPDVAAIPKTARVDRAALDIPVTMKLYATAESTAVPPPVLSSAIRKPKIDSTAGEAAEADLDTSKLAALTGVAPGKATVVTVPLTNIRTPGRYDLILRFARPGFDPIDKNVTVYVRDSLAIAALFIAFGILLSLGVHAWANLRPQVVLRQRAQALVERLEILHRASASVAAKTLIARILDAMRQRWNIARSRQQVVALAPQIDIYEDIVAALPAWSAQYVRALAIRPEAVQQKLLAMLETAAAAFRDSPLDAAKVAASVAIVNAFPKTIETEVGNELQRQVDALEHELGGKMDPDAIRVRAELRLVSDRLRGHQIEAAVGSFDAARMDYVRMLARDLAARVKIAAPARGVSPGDWAALVASTTVALTRLQNAANADEAMRSIERAVGDYLRAVATGLGSMAAKLADAAKAKAVTDLLNGVEASLEAHKLTAAWQQFDAANVAYSQALAALTGQQHGLEQVGALLATAVGSGTFDVLSIIDLPGRGDELATPHGARETGKLLTRYDFLVSVIVLLVAEMIGLQVLWVDNVTWGGWASYFAAFVWGFGLDQFTYAGIAALKAR